MKLHRYLCVFIVTLLSLAALAQQQSDASVTLVETPSPSSAVVADPAKGEFVVVPSKTGSSPRPFTMFAVGGRASTLGMGVQFGTNLTPRSNLRLGFNSLSWWDFDYSGISYSSKSSLKSVDVLFDYFLTDHFRVSPGMLFYGGKLVDAKASVRGGKTLKLGEVTYTSDPASPLTGTGELTTNKIAPVFMFGFGNLVPRSKHLSVSIDLGVAYHGTPKAELDFSGNVCRLGVCQSVTTASVQSNVQAEMRKLENKTVPFKFWPIVSFGVGYRFGGAR